jgi:hypothetical protein
MRGWATGDGRAAGEPASEMYLRIASRNATPLRPLEPPSPIASPVHASLQPDRVRRADPIFLHARNLCLQ